MESTAHPAVRTRLRQCPLARSTSHKSLLDTDGLCFVARAGLAAQGWLLLLCDCERVPVTAGGAAGTSDGYVRFGVVSTAGSSKQVPTSTHREPRKSPKAGTSSARDETRAWDERGSPLATLLLSRALGAKREPATVD